MDKFTSVIWTSPECDEAQVIMVELYSFDKLDKKIVRLAYETCPFKNGQLCNIRGACRIRGRPILIWARLAVMN